MLLLLLFLFYCAIVYIYFECIVTILYSMPPLLFILSPCYVGNSNVSASFCVTCRRTVQCNHTREIEQTIEQTHVFLPQFDVSFLFGMNA